MRRLLALATLAVLTVSSSTATEQRPGASPDAGAGPFKMQMTPCLIARRSAAASPCPEPPRPDGSPSKKVAAHLSRALFFVEVQELDNAATEVVAAAQIQPLNADVHHFAARLALTVGALANAERDIAEARRLAPDNMDIRATSASILRGRAPIEALAELDIVLAAHPDHVFARHERVNIHLEQDGYAYKALADLTYLASKFPKDVVILTKRANALLGLGEPRPAIADLTAALAIDPGAFHLLVKRADAHARNEDALAAVADLTSVLGPVGGRSTYAIAGEDLAQLLIRRTMLLAEMKRYAEAATDMATAVSVGGRPSVLRAQVFLRRNGFPDVALNGTNTPDLQTALEGCFRRSVCFQGLIRTL